jgi:hypothetical protein
MRIILNNVFVKFFLDRREIRVLYLFYREVKVAAVELIDLIMYVFEALSLIAFLARKKVVKDLY